MCNRYANRVPYSQYVEAFSDLKIPLVFPKPNAAPNLEPVDNIFPTNQASIIRPLEGGVELRQLRWGLIPWFHKGTAKEWKLMTTNARSETVATSKTFKSAFEKHRCLVPLSNFYEWTGEKGHKTKWSFSRKDAEWFCFAGIWDRAKTADGEIESYSLVTIPAGPDVVEYHDRQPIVLERDQYSDWMNPKSALGDFTNPPAAGLLNAVKREV